MEKQNKRELIASKKRKGLQSFIKKIKAEKGSITAVVLVTIMFLITILATSYAVTATLRQTQLKSQLAIKEQYEDDIKNVNEIAAKLSANSNNTNLAEIAELREEINSLKAELTEAKSSINTLDSSVSDVQTTLSDMKDTICIRHIYFDASKTAKIQFTTTSAHNLAFGIADVNGYTMAFFIAPNGCTKLGGTGGDYFSMSYDASTLTYTINTAPWSDIWLFGPVGRLGTATITVE